MPVSGEWDGSSPANSASKQAFKGKKPNRIVSVPPEFRRTTVARERERIVQAIKANTNCDVLIYWDNGMIYKFEIFGSGNGVDRAVGELNQWIENAPAKSTASSSWAKLKAFDNKKWCAEQINEWETSNKQLFKGDIPEGEEAPRFKVTVNWPEDLTNANPPVTPSDAFGNKLKALDSIRTGDEVFITLLPKRNELWQVLIQGFEPHCVDAAERHYNALIQRVRVETFKSKNTITIILDDPEGIDVILEQAPCWWPNKTCKIAPRLLPSPIMNDPGGFRQETLHCQQLSPVQDAIHLALEAVRYKKGFYDLSVRLGCLSLGPRNMPDSEIGKKYSKDAFQDAIKGGRVDCNIKKWFADHELGEQVLVQLMAADHLLEPTKSTGGWYGYTPTTLKDTRPIFRGTWVFTDPSVPLQPVKPARHLGRPSTQQPQNQKGDESKKPLTSMIVVQIEWTDDEEGSYEKMPPRYFILKPGHVGPEENMDVNLIELGESKAWHFGLESMAPLPKHMVSPALRSFADKVTMKPGYANNLASKESFAQWDRDPTFMRYLRNGRLDKVYSFALKKTCYKVEALEMWYPNQRMPCWGVRIHHSEWATHLAELERLPLGNGADWGDTMTTFLPDNGLTSSATQEDKRELKIENLKVDNDNIITVGDGLRLLVTKLMQLSEVISSAGKGGVGCTL